MREVNKFIGVLKKFSHVRFHISVCSYVVKINKLYINLLLILLNLQIKYERLCWASFKEYYLTL